LAAKTQTARSLAYEVVHAVAAEGAYANLVLPSALGGSSLSERDRALATELVYGSLRREGELDVVIVHAGKRNLDSLQAEVVTLLRLGVYQMLYLRIPDHAAVDETVNLAKDLSLHRAAGLINAVLRNVSRQSEEHWARVVAEDMSSIDAHPAWIAEKFATVLGSLEGSALLHQALEAHNDAPRVTLVHLPGFSTPADGLCEYSPLGSTLESGNPIMAPGVSEGFVRVQDEGSQLAALLLSRVESLEPGSKVLDMCAGPGGKTAVLAGEAIAAGAQVEAWEKAPHRAKLVEQSISALSRASPSTVTIRVGDALTLSAEEGSFQRILVDAPCSGLGALRRRPEARWRKTPEDLEELVPLQRALLARALTLVAPGGIVAYVTCSPVVEETSEVVSWEMESRPDIELIDTPEVLDRVAKIPVVGSRRDQAVQLWTFRHGCDDMFIQLLRKKS
jgi:16S rRNA (cytosine967-C5)-methyltransferase